MRRRGASPIRVDQRRHPISFQTEDVVEHGTRALENTGVLSYRRALWDDQDVHVEIWSEKDAIRSVIYPVTAEFDVPLMMARGYPSESYSVRHGAGDHR